MTAFPVPTDWAQKWAVYSRDKVAFRSYESGQTLTYGELDRLGDHLAHHWRQTLGLAKGERIAVLAENGLEFVLNFGAGVGAFDDGDAITVALNVDSVPPIAQAPLPASALLLLGGIGAAGFASRRRKNKS